jgi:predicted flavoprotein YhiN
MAAEGRGGCGRLVDLYDTMPSVGRKFLLAGKGGLNLTHSEDLESFLAVTAHAAPRSSRCCAASGRRSCVRGRGPRHRDLRRLVGRVFPTDMKAAPLLRAWLARLRAQGVRLHMRHRVLGLRRPRKASGCVSWPPDGERDVHADALVLALGGASWPRLGSDGAWTAWLADAGVAGRAAAAVELRLRRAPRPAGARSSRASASRAIR